MTDRLPPHHGRPDPAPPSAPAGPGASTSGPSPRPEAVRRALPAHFRDKSPLTDTAGVSWEGRDYTVSPFPDDDGSAPPALAAALGAVRAGEDPDRRALVAALRGTRVLVPIMAVATEQGVTAHGLTGDNGADMAMVTIAGADGSSALPVFSAVAELSAWRGDARPVPVVAEQAAQAAVQEGCTALLLDAGTPLAPALGGGPVVLTRSALWALAQGRNWTPPFADPVVLAELERLVPLVDGVLSLGARAGTAREVDLLVRLRPGLTADEVRTVVSRLGDALGASAPVAERITSLRLVLEG